MKHKKQVFSYLAKNKLMVLGTSFKNKPWGATVFFVCDKNLNFFFFSSPRTLHCRNIGQNPHVSAVVHGEWKGRGSLKGIQLSGKASRVGRKDLRFYRIFRARFPWADKFPDHVLYKIKPREVYYIDYEFFGHFSRVRVF